MENFIDIIRKIRVLQLIRYTLRYYVVLVDLSASLISFFNQELYVSIILNFLFYFMFHL